MNDLWRQRTVAEYEKLYEDYGIYAVINNESINYRGWEFYGIDNVNYLFLNGIMTLSFKPNYLPDIKDIKFIPKYPEGQIRKLQIKSNNDKDTLEIWYKQNSFAYLLDGMLEISLPTKTQYYYLNNRDGEDYIRLFPIKTVWN